MSAAQTRPPKPRGFFREQAPNPEPTTFRPAGDTDAVIASIDGALLAWERTKGWELYKVALYALGQPA